MAKIGDKRPAEKQIASDDVDSDDMSPATPTSSLPVLFRPSSLSSAASNLTTYSRGQTTPSSSSSSSVPLQLGSPDTLTRLKFTKPQIITQKPFDVNGTISSTVGFKRSLDNGDTNEGTSSKRSNLFITCLEENTETEEDHEKGKGFLFGRQLASRVVNAEGRTTVDTDTPHPQKEDTNKKDSETGNSNENQSPSPAFQGHPSPVLLPTVETVTGEEGERHVTQISCKLFVFESSSHNWREKGRGELHLNDAPQSDGVYQSRLIMRAIGSYRVLLNTHLWSKMKCEKANQRTIRITAQENEGGFGVYVIKAAPKDIHQLYTAIDHRLDALQKSDKQDTSPFTSKITDNTKSPNTPPSGSFDEDDSELGDRTSIHSSPESSPERQMERLGNPTTTSSFPTGAPIIVSPPCSSSHSLVSSSSTNTITRPFTSSKDAVSFVSVVSDPVVSSSDPIVTSNKNKKGS